MHLQVKIIFLLVALQEFKLNPGAKIFSPSFANQVSATPTMPTIANVACAPGNPPIVALAAAQPDIGISSFAPRSSPPSKFVPYSNLIAGTGGGVSQFSQPVRTIRRLGLPLNFFLGVGLVAVRSYILMCLCNFWFRTYPLPFSVYSLFPSSQDYEYSVYFYILMHLLTRFTLFIMSRTIFWFSE